MSYSAEQEGRNSLETLFRTSWLTDGVPSHIINPLAMSQTFLEMAGLWALPTGMRPGKIITKNSIRPHVVEYFGAHDEILHRVAQQRLLEEALRIHHAEIFQHHEYQGAIIELHTRLLLDLLDHRGIGYDIECLSEMFIRPPSWEFPEGLPDNLLEAFIQAKDGARYKIFLPHLKERRKWKPEDWEFDLAFMHQLTHEDRAFIRDEIAAKRQPYIDLNVEQAEPNTPLTARAALGVNLATLKPEEINELAKHGYFCDPSCHRYHGDVDMYKSLQELIAPVDASVIGERLLETYNQWQRSGDLRNKFRILIPAQADEKTIAGLLDYLHAHGIYDSEIKKTMSFVLADLCVTPLLRAYAELKERELLKITHIVSMDVFHWKDDGETFHFIATDHFIDLFAPTTQRALIESLTSCLADGGELVLTTRCGRKNPISATEIMNDFHQRVDLQILTLLNLLNANHGSEEATDHTVFKTKTQVAQAIYSLLVYRQLRNVYPFRNIASLKSLLIQIGKQVEEDDVDGKSYFLDVSATPSGKNKARIVVSRKRITRIDPISPIRTLFSGAAQ